MGRIWEGSQQSEREGWQQQQQQDVQSQGRGHPSAYGMGVVEITVRWEEGRQVSVAPPAPQEIAAILLGLEETYQVLANSLGYPPHFLRVMHLRNPELKFDLGGGKEVIDALRELLLAVPRLVASLFRPRAALRLADQEYKTQMSKLEEQAAAAEAGRIEADARRLRAEIERLRLRQQLNQIPLQTDSQAHAILWGIGAALEAVEPTKRVPFIGETARYLIATQSYEPSSRVVLIPADSPHQGTSET